MPPKGRIKPGYKPGAMTRELAMTLSIHLWELIRTRASSEILELLYLRDSMEFIASGLGENDALSDPLGSIVKALQFLDGKVESPDLNANTP